jgi:hypothetical protein
MKQSNYCCRILSHLDAPLQLCTTTRRCAVTHAILTMTLGSIATALD